MTNNPKTKSFGTDTPLSAFSDGEGSLDSIGAIDSFN